jgi:hypothetical protein
VWGIEELQGAGIGRPGSNDASCHAPGWHGNEQKIIQTVVQWLEAIAALDLREDTGMFCVLGMGGGRRTLLALPQGAV